MLLFGRAPFEAEDINVTYKLIEKVEFFYPNDI
jgi:hypothetical protein